MGVTTKTMENLPYQYQLLLQQIGATPGAVRVGLALRIFTPRDVCSFLMSVYTSPTNVQVIDAAMASAVNMTLGETMAAGDLCGYINNIDAIRGLRLQQVEDKEELADVIIDNWNGEEFKPSPSWFKEQNLKESYLGYKSHFYKATAAAYDVNRMSENEIAWTGFYNFSGAGPSGTYWPRKSSPSMPKIVNLFHSAVLKESEIGLGEVRYQNMPKKFTCNRDEWITKSGVELECDMLPAILNQSIPDLVFRFFMSFFMVCAIYFPVSSIVYEKEHKLRGIMVMMGLSSPVYWLVTYSIELLKFEITFCSIQLIGYLTDLRVFVIHDQVLVWLLIFLWGNITITMSIAASNIFRSTRTANAICLLFILLIVQMEQIVAGNLQLMNTGSFYYLLPQTHALSLIYVLAVYAFAGVPITFNNFFLLWEGELGLIVGLMVVHWIFWALVAFYLENAAGNLGWLWCTQKSWFRANCGKRQRVKLSKKLLQEVGEKLHASMNGYERPHDVQEEHDWVTTETDGAADKAGHPHIRIVNLHKKFGSGETEKVAVKSVSFGVKRNECFGLLGHNGAGKTSVINVLTGALRSSGGTAFMGELCIDSDLGKIYEMMGVCPQHDILWPNLTAREHLLFFARLKGFSRSTMKKLVDDAL